MFLNHFLLSFGVVLITHLGYAQIPSEVSDAGTLDIEGTQSCLVSIIPGGMAQVEK